MGLQFQGVCALSVVASDVLSYLFFPPSFPKVADVDVSILAFLTKGLELHFSSEFSLFYWSNHLNFLPSFLLFVPVVSSINFMGYKPCEHSLLTGTNRKVTDPSGGSYWSVTMDYPYHRVVSFKSSLKPCGATGTNPQVLEPLTITFQPFLKGLEKLRLAC